MICLRYVKYSLHFSDSVRLTLITFSELPIKTAKQGVQRGGGQRFAER